MYLWASLATLFFLMATFSRGAWLGLIIFSAIIGFLKNPKIILIISAILFILFFTSENIHKRIEDIYNPPATSSIYWRIERWSDNYNSFTKKPLLGHGSGTELVVYEEDYGFYSSNNYTHNDILKNAVELGIVGTIIYLMLVGTTLISLFSYYLKSKIASEKNLYLITFALFVSINAFSMTSNIFRGTAAQWILWALIGVCLGLTHKTKKKS
jgi:O-antigen ligase